MKLLKSLLGILIFAAAFAGAVCLLFDKSKERYVQIDRDSGIYY